MVKVVVGGMVREVEVDTCPAADGTSAEQLILRRMPVRE
jgi:hypothetical protein